MIGAGWLAPLHAWQHLDQLFDGAPNDMLIEKPEVAHVGDYGSGSALVLSSPVKQVKNTTGQPSKSCSGDLPKVIGDALRTFGEDFARTRVGRPYEHARASWTAVTESA